MGDERGRRRLKQIRIEHESFAMCTYKILDQNHSPPASWGGGRFPGRTYVRLIIKKRNNDKQGLEDRETRRTTDSSTKGGAGAGSFDGEEPVLEFRSRPDWPTMFEAWPGEQADEYGPVLRLRTADMAGDGAFAARLRGERDRWMLLALVRLLPTSVATATRPITPSR